MKITSKLSRSQNGIAHVLLIIVIVLVAAVGLVGYRVVQNQDKKEPFPSSVQASNKSTSADANTQAASPAKYIEWSFDGEKWMALNQGNPAPDCAEPLTIKAPMDVSKATSVLYPGQVRGGDFKPHGGIGSDNAAGNKIDVKMPYGAYLYRGAKYQEMGEIQYMLDFVAPCGIMVRLDHLRTLSSEFEALTKELPTGAESDSRTTKFTTNTFVKEGTLVAVEAGFKSTNNAFFDLGVYDLRKPNAASKDPVFANEPKRKADKEQSYYSLCWMDLLTGTEKTTVSSLPARGSEGKTSDYCK